MTIVRTLYRCVLLALAAPALYAQAPAAPAPAACTYNTCALRVEPVFLGVALVRGAAGDSTVRLGGFGKGVDMLYGRSDSATAYARQFVSANKTSSVLSLIAVAALVTVQVRTDRFTSSADAADVAITIVGASAALASIPFVFRSQRALSRAVWWYNASLPR